MQFSHSILVFTSFEGCWKNDSSQHMTSEPGPQWRLTSSANHKNLRPTYCWSDLKPTNSLNLLDFRVWFFSWRKKTPKNMYCEVPVYFIRCIIGLVLRSRFLPPKMDAEWCRGVDTSIYQLWIVAYIYGYNYINYINYMLYHTQLSQLGYTYTNYHTQLCSILSNIQLYQMLNYINYINCTTIYCIILNYPNCWNI
jgi:hypothetical protein